MSGRFWVYAMIGVLIAGSVLFQFFQIYAFMSAGPRFTAQDGQELCQRVQALEKYSYGFHDAGKRVDSCNYGVKP